MRTIEQIRADWDLVEDESGSDWGPIELAEERLYNDIPDLLAALAEKDAEIERLHVEIDERDTWSEQRARDAWKDHQNANRIIDDLQRENQAAMAHHASTGE